MNLGVSSAGGIVGVHNTAGANVANLGVSSAGGGGGLDILSSSGQIDAQLAAHAQGGYLAITTPGGSARVEAGVTAGSVGVVRAFGPGGFNAIEGRTNGS